MTRRLAELPILALALALGAAGAAEPARAVSVTYGYVGETFGGGTLLDDPSVAGRYDGSMRVSALVTFDIGNAFVLNRSGDVSDLVTDWAFNDGVRTLTQDDAVLVRAALQTGFDVQNVGGFQVPVPNGQIVRWDFVVQSGQLDQPGSFERIETAFAASRGSGLVPNRIDSAMAGRCTDPISGGSVAGCSARFDAAISTNDPGSWTLVGFDPGDMAAASESRPDDAAAVAVVPEPGAALLLAATGTVLGVRRRR